MLCQLSTGGMGMYAAHQFANLFKLANVNGFVCFRGPRRFPNRERLLELLLRAGDIKRAPLEKPSIALR
jgi:hypothetical protein